jgi:hypothetical protein
LDYPSIDILGEAMGAVWNMIREECARQLAAKGMTQTDIAAGGGGRQNNVSRMPANDKRGPTVEIFVQHLLGSGMKLSDFFAAIEDQFPTRDDAPLWTLAAGAEDTADTGRRPPVDDPTKRQLALAIGYTAIRTYQLGQAHPLPPRDRGKKT